MMAPEQIARIAHEANRALQHVQAAPGIPVAPPWEEFPAEERESVIDGVARALAGADLRELHDAWCRRKTAEGWRHGPVKDPAAKTHPCLVPYDHLPAEQRRKDLLFAAIVGALNADLQQPAPARTSVPVPSVGRVVHYVSYGSAGGEYVSQCRAAVVTEVNAEEPLQVGLCVLNPAGVFFRSLAEGGCFQAEGEHRGGTWHWPERT